MKTDNYIHGKYFAYLIKVSELSEPKNCQPPNCVATFLLQTCQDYIKPFVAIFITKCNKYLHIRNKMGHTLCELVHTYSVHICTYGKLVHTYNKSAHTWIFANWCMFTN